MIKINLLPSASPITSAEEAAAGGADAGATQEIQRKGLVHIVMMLILPAALYVWGAQAKPQKEAQLAAIRNQVAEIREFNDKYQGITAEIEQIRKDEQSVQQRIKALNEVTSGRLAEIKLLDLVQTIMRDRMWLRKLEIKEGKVILEGMAQSEIDVNALLEDLTKNVLFATPPRLAESNQETYEGQSFSRFKIEAILEKQK